MGMVGGPADPYVALLFTSISEKILRFHFCGWLHILRWALVSFVRSLGFL